MRLYVGTYTDEGGPGIWFGELNGETLARRFVVKDADNPSYLLLSADASALFAVCGNGERGYFVLSYDLSGDGARLVSKQAVSGKDPCHLVLSADEDILITANYGDGSVSVFPVEGKRILPESQFIRHAGKSVNPARQEAPHAHHVSIAPEDKSLLRVVDLGIDKLVSYRLDPSGRLSLAGEIGLRPGSGPRHLATARNGRWMYVCCELSSEVTFIENMTVIETLSTLPGDFVGESSCAAIRVSDDERRLYVSNRGHDSIAVFSIGEDGAPTLDRHILSGGKCPRDFVILPDGRLLAANQREGGLVLLDDGGCVLSRADIPGAVAIVF